MEVTVTGRHVDITDPIRDYATGKVGKLPRYFDRISHIEVVADKANHNFDVEIIVKVDGTPDPFIATATGQDLYGCIDQSVDKLERQLTDHKTKLRNRKHNTASS